ncbi:hypothetical protein REPUB_Repub05bG0014400 [Reevesia pubescens]
MWCLLKPYQFFLFLFLCFLNFQPNLSLSSSPTTQLCSQDEAAALIQFKSSFSVDEMASWDCDDAGTISYPKTNSWKEDTDCCSWDGVTCDNGKGQVIGLDLSCSWLYGSFPFNSSLFHLPHLQKLNLAFNYFDYSKMSSEFGRFASLVYLNLSYTFFPGQVPSQISHLSKLVSLDISGNYDLTLGKHTLEGLVQNLTEVRQLLLDRVNMFSTNPNVFMNLSSSLNTLSLSDCDLRGKFPENIIHLPNLKLLSLGDNENLNLNFPKLNRSYILEHLDLSSISLSRELFDSIMNLVSLKHLDLRWSNLSGSIPRSLGNLSQLNFLDLSGNHLSGQMPSSITNLITLYLSSNLLNGTLPSWLFNISSLKHIDLSYNQFSGHIKEFQYKSLESISFSNTNLQGPLPSSISQQVDLTLLFLSSNNLSGIVEFGMFSKLQNLKYLDLSYNSLSLNSNGTSADYTLPNLISLHLSSCNVHEFPRFLEGAKSLIALDLSNNRIYGKIPKWMWGVGKDSLYYLNLSHNSLTEVEQLPWNEIIVIDLSSNLIHGYLPIPPSTTHAFSISNNSLIGKISSLICNVSSLEILDLSHNNFSGIIPQCFGNLSKSLSFLNLQMNKFRGIIPPTFAEGCHLSNLKLNGNQLQGPLTRSIVNCKGLEVLDLGNNKINDTFPHWLGSLPLLQVLVLRSNQFHGSIQDISSNSFSNIQIFDFSSNYFTGPLPARYISNFKAMINLSEDGNATSIYMGLIDHSNFRTFYSYSIGIVIKGMERELKKIFFKFTSIDLSNNKFEGEIPKVIGKLNSLKGLNLSHNKLSGCIPTSIGNLTSLEWRFVDLTSLAFLNLSENQLHGQIPQGKQFNTFEKDSYEGNKGLCGFPVSKGCSTNERPPSQLPPSNLLEEDGSKSNIDFGWKVVVIGYGCGVMFGLAMGYVVFQTGKPKWFVTLVEDQCIKRRKKSRIGKHSCRGRRI